MPAPPSGAPADVPAGPFAHLPADAVVAVAMSGGVDSSVAAARCVESGLRTLGITLALWPSSREMVRDRGCCSIDAVEDARRVAAALGIPHYVWNLEGEFEAEIVREFEEGYAAGVTPNPCVRCNEKVKFGLLLERARAAGATHVATGHYARRGRRDDRWTLHRSLDTVKDQSYTLHRLDQEQLGAAVFPLGDVAGKGEVRREAARRGLLTSGKAESQDLCFVDGPLRDELARRLDGRFRPGPILDLEGRTIGEHRGLPFLTVGQRTGLGIATRRPDARPLHVIAIDAVTNSVVAGPAEALRRDALAAADCRWVSGAPPRPGRAVHGQLRAHGRPTAMTVVAAGGGEVSVRCDPPVVQAAPGQSLVLYDGDEVLGGGILSAAVPAAVTAAATEAAT